MSTSSSTSSLHPASAVSLSLMPPTPHGHSIIGSWIPFLVAEVGGSTQSAYDYHELLNAFTAGHVTPTSLVYRADVTGDRWVPLQSLPALTHELGIRYVPLAGEGEGDGGWFYLDDDANMVRAGDWEALRAAREQGQLTEDSLVWRAGMAEWRHFKAVPQPTSSSPARPLLAAPSSPAAAAVPTAAAPFTADDVKQDGDEEDGEEAKTEGAQSAPSTAGGAKRKRKRKRRGGAVVNSAVYVTGLPVELTEEEAVDFFKKAGVLKEDVLTGEKKIRLHLDEQGRRKGDATVTYMFPASVPLAFTLLDGAEIKPGYPLKVTEATFDPPPSSSSSSSSSAAPHKKTKVELTLKRRQKENALSWVGDDSSFSSPLPPSIPTSTALGLRIVVLKRVFSPTEAASSPDPDAFFDELCSDVGEEVERTCGEVDKMTVYEHSEEGVLIVKFKTAEGAERCVERMKGRWFGGRQLQVEWFDGTDYSKKETEEETKRRLDRFGEELEQGREEGG